MLEFILQDLLAYTLIEVTEIMAMVVFLSNVVTMTLPNHSKYKSVQWILDVLNTLSLNIAKNANKLYHVLDHRDEEQKQVIIEAIDKAIDRRERKARRDTTRKAGATP